MNDFKTLIFELIINYPYIYLPGKWQSTLLIVCFIMDIKYQISSQKYLSSSHLYCLNISHRLRKIILCYYNHFPYLYLCYWFSLYVCLVFKVILILVLLNLSTHIKYPTYTFFYNWNNQIFEISLLNFFYQYSNSLLLKYYIQLSESKNVSIRKWKHIHNFIHIMHFTTNVSLY